MAHTPTSIPIPAPAIEQYKSRLLLAVVILATLSLAIAMIVHSYSKPSKAEAAGLVRYSMEPPIYFGPSKCVAIDLKPDEWSPVIITPERCKSAIWTVNPPVGYLIELPGGKKIEVTPDGEQGFLPPAIGRGEYRFRGAQAGQKLVMRVTY